MDIKSTREIEMDECESESISNVHRELAVRAASLFDKGDYLGSLTELSKLQEQRPLDTRITHNAAVVTFYNSKFKNLEEFKTRLNTVCNQGEINLDNVDSLDDVRNCYIYFNKAVVLYHLMQYSSALKILNKMFTFVEVLDENLKRSLTLLLAEALLRVHQPDKALSVITYVENLMHQIESVRRNSMDQSDLAKHDEYYNGGQSDERTKWFKYKLKEYKCKCYLSLQNEQAAEKELTDVLNNMNRLVFKDEHTDENLFKIRCNHVKWNLKFLTSYCDYLKKNYKSCVRTMTSIPLENNFASTGDSVKLAFFNNMGCIHLYMGKPNLSTVYFRNALKENERNRKLVNADENDRLLYTYGENKLPQLVYNLGISLLHSGKPTEAFDCLTLAVQVYHMNPRLWLRLAECCIMVHKNGNERDFDFINKRKEVLQEVVGTGIHRKLLLNLNSFENNKYSYDAQSFAIPVASLEFATLCLRNALLLLSGTGVDYSPSSPISATRVVNLRAAVLVASAYVSLCLGDPIVAINNCRNVLSIPNCSNVHKLLAHLYIAEAFIFLDRIPEALEHLKTDFGNYGLPAESAEYHLSARQWKPGNSASARAVFQYNLAAVLALKGDLLKAAELLKQVWLTKGPQCDIPVQIISLALYIELSLGHADIARNIVKQNCPQYNTLSPDMKNTQLARGLAHIDKMQLKSSRNKK